jgi:hypothetical protein
MPVLSPEIESKEVETTQNTTVQILIRPYRTFFVMANVT